MRDRIMTDQLEVLDGNKLDANVAFDGLRKVENLPKDIHKSSDELYLPPIFAERKSQASNRQGIQITSELNKPLPKIDSARIGINAQRSSLDNLHRDNYKTRNLNKFSHFDQARNRHYKNPAYEGSYGRPLGYKPQYTPGKYNTSGRVDSGLTNKYHPASAYAPVRQPMNRYYSGSLPRARPYEGGFKSPGQTRPDSSSLTKQFTPITKEDFTLEALQQKKIALDRLNDRMKNL